MGRLSRTRTEIAWKITEILYGLILVLLNVLIVLLKNSRKTRIHVLLLIIPPNGYQEEEEIVLQVDLGEAGLIGVMVVLM